MAYSNNKRKSSGSLSGGHGQSKNSNVSPTQNSSIYRSVSDKVFPSFSGRQASMLEFFQKKNVDSKSSQEIEIVEDDSGLITTTTTTTTITTVVTKVVTPNASPSPSQQNQQNSNSPASPIPFNISSALSQRTSPLSQQSQSQVILLDGDDELDADQQHPIKKLKSENPIQVKDEIKVKDEPVTDAVASTDLENSEFSRYYLKDFTTVTDTVITRDAHLFEEEELSMVERFHSMNDNARHLFVRLYNRKGPWFIRNSIVYDEIKDVKNSCEELVKCQFLHVYDNQIDDYNEIAPLLPVNTMKRIIGSASCPKDATKPILLEILKGNPAKGQTTISHFNGFQSSPKHRFKKLVEDNIGQCLKVSNIAMNLWHMVHHLFFFNWQMHNSTSLIVNNIMGIRFPEYEIWGSNSTRNTQSNQSLNIFETRAALLEFENVKQIEETFIFSNSLIKSTGNDKDEVSTIVTMINDCAEKLSTMASTSDKNNISFALKFTPGWIYTRVLSSGVALLEKIKEYDQAIFHLMLLTELPFCPGKRGHWWQRMVINMKHLNRSSDALIICERALKDDRVTSGDRLALENHYLQLTKNRSVNVPDGLIRLSNNLKKANPVTVYCEKVETGLPGRKSRYFIENPEDKEKSPIITNVEGVALNYYATECPEKWKGIHCETSIFLSMFVMFFWDIVFDSSIPFVFQSPFQDAPLDFGTNQFYTSRANLINERVEELKESSCAERQSTLLDIWEKHHGEVVRCINWDKYTLEQLIDISNHVGGGLIGFCSKLIAEDYSCFAHGMPDLLLWSRNPDDQLEDSYFIKFVEVKGAGDTLSSQQKIWIDMLLNFGCDVDICHIKNKQN